MIELCPDEVVARVTGYLDERFGLPRGFCRDFTWYAGPNGRIMLGPTLDVDLTIIDTTGLLIARIGKGIKPTTDLFQTFGHLVNKSIVRLSRSEVAAFCSGETTTPDPSRIGSATRGYVMAAYGALPLGCGLLKEGRLESQIARPVRLKLRYW